MLGSSLSERVQQGCGYAARLLGGGVRNRICFVNRCLSVIRSFVETTVLHVLSVRVAVARVNVKLSGHSASGNTLGLVRTQQRSH